LFSTITQAILRNNSTVVSDQRGQVKEYKLFSSKEKQTWVIKEKKIKAKGNNRKKHSLIQRKNGKPRKKRRINKF